MSHPTSSDQSTILSMDQILFSDFEIIMSYTLASYKYVVSFPLFISPKTCGCYFSDFCRSGQGLTGTYCSAVACVFPVDFVVSKL